MSTPLPIDFVMPQLLQQLRDHACVVLSADPGAGKTTRVPVAILQSGIARRKILMLEPRRLAAMRAAQYMCMHRDGNMDEQRVGQLIGYRIRGETRIGPQTRIEVVTEGILTRLLQSDPELRDYDVVILDEFHERSIHADLGLALCLEVQNNLRDDLKILVMSATLDGVAISQLLNNAPVVSSEGRSYPVQTHYAEKMSDGFVESAVVSTITRSLRDDVGDILVFLPGQREIARVQKLLSITESTAEVHALYGEARMEQQQAALRPSASGQRKIILATSIAETSLTIDGVGVVIDSGLVRTQRFDPRRGMSGLITVNVSQATADQRRGRAGRQFAGVCYRMWTADRQSSLSRYPTPELLQSDLAPLVLELALWGTDEAALQFLDPPPAAHMAQARQLLRSLGALDSDHRISTHGRHIIALPTHPRYAHALLRARDLGIATMACDIVALLEERDLLRGQDADFDMHSRWQALRYGGAGDRQARERALNQSARLQQLLGVSAPRSSRTTSANDFAMTGENKIGLIIAWCFPERVARRRDSKGERWQLANGVGASLRSGSRLNQQEWLAVAELDGEGQEARIFLAEDIAGEDLEQYLPEMLVEQQEVFWSERDDAVVARRIKRYGKLTLSENVLAGASVSKAPALCEGMRRAGWSQMGLSDAAVHWLARLQWLQSTDSGAGLFPPSDSELLLATLEDWLAPFLDTVSRRTQWRDIDWLAALQARLSYAQLQQLNRLAPTHWTVPTGSEISLDYTGNTPILAVRLQEMFGQRETPRIADGRYPVLIHLLSPARRPLAVTQDLASFWANAYADVRKDMRGQYPRHYWPEDPLQAEPTRRTKAADDRAARLNTNVKRP